MVTYTKLFSFHLNLIQTMFKKFETIPAGLLHLGGWVRTRPGTYCIVDKSDQFNGDRRATDNIVSTTDFCGQITIRVTECQLCQSLWL